MRLKPSSLVAALVLAASCGGPGTPSLQDDPQAQSTAEAFARAFIETGWEGAKAFVTSTGPTQEQIARDHTFFLDHQFVISGDARYDDRVGLLSGPGYVVPVHGLEGQQNVQDADIIEWTIGVELVRDGNSWKVAGYDYTAGPPVG